MKINNKHRLFVIPFFLLLVSCVPRSQYTILHDMRPDSLYSTNFSDIVIVKPQDRINIVVRSNNPSLSIPFNTPGGIISLGNKDFIVSEPDFGRNEKINSIGSGASGGISGINNSGYFVDDEGYIVFPILGKISVAGLTLNQVSKKIEDLIVAGNYIKEPMVETRFLEFRVYIINGNSGNVIQAPTDKFNIIQAISQGLILGQQVRMDHVAVIRRNKDGKNRIYFNNLLNTEVFNSPTFYLEPGDIIYVQPKYQKAEAVDLDNVFKYTSYIFTTVFTVTSILNIFNK